MLLLLQLDGGRGKAAFKVAPVLVEAPGDSEVASLSEVLSPGVAHDPVFPLLVVLSPSGENDRVKSSVVAVDVPVDSRVVEEEIRKHLEDGAHGTVRNDLLLDFQLVGGDVLGPARCVVALIVVCEERVRSEARSG